VVVVPFKTKVRGQVSLRSADPADPPRISISLLGSETDRAKLLRGCKLAYAALREGPGRAMGGQIYAPAASPRTMRNGSRSFATRRPSTGTPPAPAAWGPDRMMWSTRPCAFTGFRA